ncbi:MAG: hypothetical protein WD735_04020 [Balneolaceae bacterium]
MKTFASPFLLLLLLSLCINDSSNGQFLINGLYQNYNAFQTTPDHELLAGRNRLRLKLNNSLDVGGLYAESDLIHRYTESENIEIQLREIYLDWYFDNLDLRIGKQTIIWGRADGGFITDILSPVDLREFLTQSPSDLRFGITAINAIHYFGANSLQLIVSPTFQKDLLPAQESPWFPVQTIDSPFPLQFTDDPEQPTAKNVQAAAKYSLRSPNNIDLDLSLLYWTHPMPAYALTINLINFPGVPSVTLQETYQPSPMAGISLAWSAHPNWLIKSESLFVYERLFTFLPVPVNRLEQALDDLPTALQVLQEFEFRDDGYLLTKPWLQNMLGIQTTVQKTTISAQAYLETIFNYEDRILSQQLFPYATLFATRSFLRDRLQATTAGRVNFYAKDYWIQLQATYDLADDLEFTLGTNLFGGNSVSPFYGHFTFNQFRENSFLFSRFAIYF